MNVKQGRANIHGLLQRTQHEKDKEDGKEAKPAAGAAPVDLNEGEDGGARRRVRACRGRRERSERMACDQMRMYT